MSPTAIVTIAAPSRVMNHRRRGFSFGDDSSSTKTEIEEMDQFSDLEDNNGTEAAGGAASEAAQDDDKKASKVSRPRALQSNIFPLPLPGYF